MMNLICLTDLILFLIDYFEYTIKIHETLADNLPLQIYVNKIKTGYKLELLTEETMQLLGNSTKDIDQNKDGEIVPKLETAEVVLIHCNLVNNNYQQASKVLFTFVQNKQFGQLTAITPHSLRMSKTTNGEFSGINFRIFWNN